MGSNMQTPLTLEDTQAAADLMAPEGTDPQLNDIATPYDIESLDNPRRVYQRGMNPSVDLRHQGARIELTYDAGPVIIEALGSYRDLVFDNISGGNAGVVYPGYNFANPNTPDNFSGNQWHTTSKSTIAELRLYAPDTARFRWALGGFYFNEDQYAFLGQISDPANGFGGGEFNMPDVQGGSIAGYADGTFDITERLRVLGGVRVTNEHKSRKNGLWALWQNFPGNAGRFGTEGFKYAEEDRTIFGLAPTTTVTERVNAFLDGIKSFGARDQVAQQLCADPPAATAGQAQTPRVRPSATGGMECTSGIHPNLLQQEEAANADPTLPKPFNINMIPQNDEIEGNTFFDWRVGSEFDLAKDSMVYGTVTTGHKAGGFNDTIRDPMGNPQNPPQYTPESVLAFELGSKNTLLDRRLRLNASAFMYLYKDQVFQTIVTVTEDNPLVDGDQSVSIAVRQNAQNTTTVLGLDLDVTYSLPYGLEAEVHALVMDARFADNTIVNDSRIGYDVPEYKVDIGGNWLPRAAPVTLNYMLSQFLPTEVGIFNWLVSGQTVGKHFMSVYNGEGNLLPAVDGSEPNTQSYRDLTRENGAARLTDVIATYTRFDLGAGWKHPDGRLSLSGYVNNVANIAYATSIISNPGLNLRFYNPPRTAGVRLRVDW
jgi:iron complex outermembrane receptor protein